MKKYFLIIIVLLVVSTITASAQETDRQSGDTVIVLLPENMEVENIEHDLSGAFRPDPKKAVWLSLVPGLGQIYNRKYWKLPLVYGGFAGLTYGFIWNNQYYKDYRRAYRIVTTGAIENASIDDQNFLNETFPNADAGRLQRGKDIFRRNRDLCVIGAVGLYVLTILDAYVDAQLFDFDMSPDLSLRVEPQVQLGFNNNAAVGVQCLLRF